MPIDMPIAGDSPRALGRAGMGVEGDSHARPVEKESEGPELLSVFDSRQQGEVDDHVANNCAVRNPINPGSLFAAPLSAWSVRDAVRLARPKRQQVLRLVSPQVLWALFRAVSPFAS
jgi:hypothetical protein